MGKSTYEQEQNTSQRSEICGQDPLAPGPHDPPGATLAIDATTALAAAIGRAGTLVLTVPESEALRATFPADAIRQRVTKKRTDNYLPHVLISRRLTQVLGGEWSIVRLREWIDLDAQRVYGSYVLIVRGVLVADTIQGWPYQPTNRDQDYGDVIECCRGAALRRMAAKSCLGCGDQVWIDDDAQEQPGKALAPPPINGVPTSSPPSGQQWPAAHIRECYQLLERAATGGTACLRAAWESLHPGKKKLLEPDKAHLKLRAEEADILGGEERQPARGATDELTGR